MINLSKNLPGKIVTFLLFGFLLFVITYKAIYVPITHDEKSASLFYPTFSVWEIIKYPGNWPSNHILNTLLIKFDEKLFGVTPLPVRLHSILSFIFFFWAIALIAKKYFSKNSVLFCLPFFLMFCNPFLLDFFGLARGYGLSNALMAGSVCCLLFYGSAGRLKYYWLTIAMAALAAYANFTLLIYWVSVHAVLAIMLLLKTQNNKDSIKKKSVQLAFTLIAALAFAALCYGPIYKMQSTNQFAYWSKESFFKDTIINQVDEFRYGNYWLGYDNIVLAKLVVATFTFSLIYSALKFLKGIQTAISDPLVIISILLLTVYTVNMLQAIVLCTPYLTTRTALSYYVLFAFVLMFLLRDITNSSRSLLSKAGLSAVMILFSLNSGMAINLKSVREWWYDANTYQVQNYIHDYIKRHPEIKSADLNTSWIFNPSFGFYSITGKTPWINLTELHTEVDTSSNTLFYYATYNDQAYLTNYTKAVDFYETQSTLLIRKGAQE